MYGWLCSVLLLAASSGTEERDTTEEDWSPYFGEPGSNFTVPLGREAVLPCVVRNLGQYKVGWIRVEDGTVLSLDTRVVTHNPRVSVSQDRERGIWRLHVRSLRLPDRGCYMCQINTTSMKKQLYCLDINVPPDIVDRESSNDMTASEGDNVTLTCKGRGRPQPRISWRRENSQPITAFTSQSGFITAETWSGDQLQLVHLDYRQTGAYYCIATNDIPPAVSKRINLLVYSAPRLETPPPREMGVTLGSTVTIACSFHGLPNTNISWHREIGHIHYYGGDYSSEESREGYQLRMQLTVRNLRPMDLGRYYCSLINQKGMATASTYLYEIQRERTSTARYPQRIRGTRPRGRQRMPRRSTTTTEITPVFPTFAEEGEELCEMAVEAERRRSGSEPCRALIGWILFPVFLVIS